MENKTIDNPSFNPKEIYMITLSFMIPLLNLAMISFAIDIGTRLANVACAVLILSLWSNIQCKLWKVSPSENKKCEKVYWYFFLWSQFAGYVLLASSLIFK